MTDPARWMRGLQPATGPRGQDVENLLTGSHTGIALPPVEEGIGLRRLYAFDARIAGARLVLDDLHLTVESSKFEDCHFRQRTRPVLAPLSCQVGSFGVSECAPVLVAVKVVRPVGRCTLTAPARRRGGV